MAITSASGVLRSYEGVEKASGDIAPLMHVLQDRGIENLWESMPGWPAARRSIHQSEVSSR
jgi:hypothetical protein